MSKRYMDFVPVKSVGKSTAVGAGASKKSTSKAQASTSKPKVVMPGAGATPRTRMVRSQTSTKVVRSQSGSARVVKSQSSARVIRSQSNGLSIRNDTKLGEVEDLSPVFVKTDVPKRPLGDSPEKKSNKKTAEEKLTEAKSKKFRGLFKNKVASKEAQQSEKKVADKSAFVTPKSPFINQDKVAKRPLSKNVYQKEIVATDEKANNASVTIINKPEKESRTGLIVAIILTIILGAVAGTVAFLLLPK